MGVTPKWTQRVTPQPNYVENPIYVVIMRSSCALLAAVNVPDNYKNELMP